jgi:nitrite reductase/ring-hydroxylating ferredoxin subunit
MRPAFRRRLALKLRGGASRDWPTRREALVAGLALAAGAVAGVKIGQQELLGGPARTSSTPSPKPRPDVALLQDSLIEPRPGRWVDVAAFEEMVEGQPLRVSVGAFSTFLVRQGDRVSGVSSICSHLPCELVWNPKQAQLLCPCHNQSFDVRGEPVVESYSVPALARVRVQIVKGRVQVLGV